MIQKFIAIGLLATSIGAAGSPALAAPDFQALSETPTKEHCHEHRVPIYGELESVQGNSFTITLTQEQHVEDCFWQVDYEIGENVTFGFDDGLRVITKDEDGQPVEGSSIDDLEIGSYVYVYAHKGEERMIAFAVADHRPRFHSFGNEERFERNHRPIFGAVEEVGDDYLLLATSTDMPIPDEILEQLGIDSGEVIQISVDENTKVVEKTQDGVEFHDGLSGLEEGDEVYVALKVDQETGEYYALTISDHSPVPRKHGKPVGHVVSIDTDANEIVVENRDGEQSTVSYDDETIFFGQSDDLTEYDVEEGDFLKVKLSRDLQEDGAVAAVHIIPGENVETE